MVVDDSGTVEQRILKIDQAIGNKWLVSEGLQPGNRVIVEGLQRVKPGSPAKVVPLAAKTAAAPNSDNTVPAAAK